MVEGIRRLKPADRAVIIGFARNGMRISETGRALNYTPTGISYRLKKIRNVTGTDPRDFFGLLSLYNSVMAISGGGKANE